MRARLQDFKGFYIFLIQNITKVHMTVRFYKNISIISNNKSYNIIIQQEVKQKYYSDRCVSNMDYCQHEQQKLDIILTLILFIKFEMLGEENQRSGKLTRKFNNTPLPIREESSIISLNFEDLQTLMKKKQKQYQDGLLIEDAKRVHSFLSEVQEQQKIKSQQTSANNRRRIKQITEKYNSQTLQFFQKEWKNVLQDTLKQLEDVGKIADEEHEAEIFKAEERIYQAYNGKGAEQVKFSKTVLEMEDQLRKLVKLTRYDEAQVVRKRLEARKTEQLRKFLKDSVEKQRKSLQKLKKQQNKQKESLSIRLARIYERQQTKGAKSIDKLVKNIRTYEIDTTKIDFKVNRILKTNESRYRSQSASVHEASGVKKSGTKQSQTQGSKPN